MVTMMIMIANIKKGRTNELPTIFNFFFSLVLFAFFSRFSILVCLITYASSAEFFLDKKIN